ncbi:hypothetical protein [Tsukamurella soli]|uniref:hypothetical protein n=1 Tax=Tsukamurella soli TaxID=644556 RepID=UPI0031EF257D
MKRELDAAGVPNGTPEPQPITGTDGKTYTPKPRPEPDLSDVDWDEPPYGPDTDGTTPENDWLDTDEVDDLDGATEIAPGITAADLANRDRATRRRPRRRRPL